MAFDLNSALAGAQSTAGLINELYYKPELMQREKEKHELAMKQGETALETSKFALSQAKATDAREAAAREAMGNKAMYDQAVSIMQNPELQKDLRKLQGAWSILNMQPGAAKAFQNVGFDFNRLNSEIVAPVEAGKQAYTNIVSGKGTPEDWTAVKNAVGTLYANTTTKNIDPAKINIKQDEDGKIKVFHGDTLLDKFNSPTDLASILVNDVEKLKTAANQMNVVLAGLGKEGAAKFIEDTRYATDQIMALKKMAISPEQNQALDVALKASPEMRAEIIKNTQKDIFDGLKSKALSGVTREVTSELDKYLSGIKLPKGVKKGSLEGDLEIMRMFDSGEFDFKLSPALQKKVEEKGIDPDNLKAAIIKETFGRKKDIAEISAKKYAADSSLEGMKAAIGQRATAASQIDPNIRLKELNDRKKEIEGNFLLMRSDAGKIELAQINKDIAEVDALLKRSNLKGGAKYGAAPKGALDKDIDAATMEELKRLLK